MKVQTMTNTEYLLRTVRESERMHGWQDTFSKMREDISKDIPKDEKAEAASPAQEGKEEDVNG